MYYKAIFYHEPKIKFEVVNVSDEEAYGKKQGVYCFVGGGVCSTFAIRETKESAINAIKKGIIVDIKKKEAEISRLKELLEQMEE